MTQVVDDLVRRLAKVCDDVAMGRYAEARELFELTRADSYPPVVSELAESFGMMLVKVESREYRLENLVEELEAARAEAEDARRRLAQENVVLKSGLRRKFSPDFIVGKSREMQVVLRMVDKVADTPVNVLITGETGTGKGLIAKALHYNSSRSGKPLVALNCSAIPEHLFESELFGIERGVATGVEMRPGCLEHANGGTVFLDEIGDMPLESQAKILRAIEEREVTRVGGRKPIPLDIRVVAATNKDLRKAVDSGGFREDLFYRLNVVHFRLPPLRERRDDIPLLLRTRLDMAAKRLGAGTMRFGSGVIEALAGYSWPGNVRELENEIERAVVLACSDCIDLDDLSESVRNVVQAAGARNVSRNASPDVEGARAETVSLVENETDAILRALEAAGGNKSEAARRLGVSREGLRKKMKRHGLA